MWSDLSGNGRDATLFESAAWADDGGLTLGATDHARTAKTWRLGTQSTTEVAFDVDFAAIPADSKMYTFIQPCKGDPNAGNGALYYKLNNRHIVYRTDNLNGTGWDTCAGVHDPSKANFLTAVRDGSKTAVLTGTAFPTQTNVRGSDPQIYETWADGGVSKLIDAYAWEVGRWTVNHYSIPGTIKSVRLYDRLLSEDELAWNRAVDEARFFGRLAETNVVVEASDYSGGIAGEYQVFGSATFAAAPAQDGSTADRIRVQTLQPDGTWGETEYLSGSAYTYEEGAGTVRIDFRKTKAFVLVVR